ncbi:MAG: hypothetical protein HOC20_00200 [Chloroflexi bacterium]|jgi:hypothetical protein|nr:hypothetical protein [Chloroflexota bacterium]
MTGASITLSLIAIVVSFLVGILSGFPLGAEGDTTGTSGETSEFDAAGIEEVGERFELSYNAIITDIASFQRDPSLERANARKEVFREFAQQLVGEYKDFGDGLQGQLDELTSQAIEEEQQ